jgi:hypothetical protein
LTLKDAWRSSSGEEVVRFLCENIITTGKNIPLTLIDRVTVLRGPL